MGNKTDVGNRWRLCKSPTVSHLWGVSPLGVLAPRGWPTCCQAVSLHSLGVDTTQSHSGGGFFVDFRAAPAAYGSSQARGPIRAAAASLRHSHSNVTSLIHRARPGVELASSGLQSGSFLLSHDRNSQGGGLFQFPKPQSLSGSSRMRMHRASSRSTNSPGLMGNPASTPGDEDKDLPPPRPGGQIPSCLGTAPMHPPVSVCRLAARLP